MAVFIDEEQLAFLERGMRERGYLEAQDMATAFNMLRANDLIWSFVVSNFLLGKEQMPIDLLFWNSDSTRMPVPVDNQIRTYWWCSPPRIGRQRICPARSTARENGASFSKERCVRVPL
jgi:hypothetical protein